LKSIVVVFVVFYVKAFKFTYSHDDNILITEKISVIEERVHVNANNYQFLVSLNHCNVPGKDHKDKGRTILTRGVVIKMEKEKAHVRLRVQYINNKIIVQSCIKYDDATS